MNYPRPRLLTGTKWRALLVLCAFIAYFSTPISSAETWRGLTVTAENRCSSYRPKDYHYPQSVERKIIERMGGRIYSPYTGKYFKSRFDTDIEHIVARSEAHDSGLCAADRSTRLRFSSDLLNLTLAAPAVNRCGAAGKCAKDAADWIPPKNGCWFAASALIH